MARFDSLPNELLGPFAEAIVTDVRRQDLAALAAFTLTCRRFYDAGNPVLYAKATVRHPYLLAWAAETGNVAILTRLLRLGMSPNTRFARAGWFRWASNILPCHDELTRDPWKFFREVYLVPDEDVQDDPDYRHHGLPPVNLWAFCSTAPAQSRFRALGAVAFPLHFAAANGHLEIISALLSAGAWLDVPSRQFHPIRWDKFLIADPQAELSPALTDHYYDMERTPLYTALSVGQDEAFWALRAGGAAILEIFSGYTSLLHHALELGNRAIAERLLDVTTAADANKKDMLGRSLFWMAYCDNNISAMRHLAKLGANVDEDFGTGYTPLFDACLFAKPDMATELLRLGAATETVFTGPYGLNLSAFEWLGFDVRGLKPLGICAWLVDHPPEHLLAQADYWKQLPKDGGITSEELKGLGQELFKLLIDAGADVEGGVIDKWEELSDRVISQIQRRILARKRERLAQESDTGL
ncbi:ankyrin repeat-containing domain protein [Chaetomidium leptoderma]|uniref:Ankyrin repeat-containing domain protein n=1 Tax=Chaetomidium leptoderma TaxID=669021 RepID=A0AAN6VH67_9PEZI|nr:ankyrin repeat-containing domain protein [Chaetomidium leptoderma]